MLLSTLITVSLHGAPVSLPDPLTLANGERAETTQFWRERCRPELLNLFRHHVYGRTPIGRPANLRFETTVTPNTMDGAAILRRVAIRFSGRGEGVINLTLFVPTNAKKPVPCFLLLNNRPPRVADPTRKEKSDFWPAEFIVSRGYAVAVIQVSDLDPDFDDGFKNGVHGIFEEPEKRTDNSWGTIGAWGWGASRVLDYLETDKDINARCVAVVGHSRGGKTALWAGAQDERFALVVSNDSGSTGAALSRGKKGESIFEVNTKFPHWFCANYKKFNGRENELPVDQHQLLALIAPRPLYIASAIEDEWADPAAEYASTVAATPVYKLFGFEGQSGDMPPVEQPRQEGRIGYHVRKGGHDLTRYDWEQFLNFADKHLK